MAVVGRPLTYAEKALWMILRDPDGIDFAEFAWKSSVEGNKHGRYRLWRSQRWWSRHPAKRQVDLCARAVGKTEGIIRRTAVFAFNYPGQQKALVAPDASKRDLLVQPVEQRLLECRITREYLASGNGSNGINKSGSWSARFRNGATIESRIPGINYQGANGLHSTHVEVDEAQAYPDPAWKELMPCWEDTRPGARLYVHGVTLGLRNQFWKITQQGSGYQVHRIMKMHRPDWSDEARSTALNGGLSTDNDYIRNVYGEHGDASNPVFVISKLLACVDYDENSFYNTDVYRHLVRKGESLHEYGLTEGLAEELPSTHKKGWRGNSTEANAKVRDWSAPDGYFAYYGGADLGFTDSPTEILVWGCRYDQSKTNYKGEVRFDILLRLSLIQISKDDQLAAIRTLFEFYGRKLKAFGIDRTGLGAYLWQDALKDPFMGERIYGYNASENVPVAWLDPEDHENWNIMDEADKLAYQNVIEFATDRLREDMVNTGLLLLPGDSDMLNEWQGSTSTIVKKAGSPYGKKAYTRGKFHTLDGMKNGVAAMLLPDILEKTKPAELDFVPDTFVGGMEDGYWSGSDVGSDSVWV